MDPEPTYVSMADAEEADASRRTFGRSHHDDRRPVKVRRDEEFEHGTRSSDPKPIDEELLGYRAENAVPIVRYDPTTEECLRIADSMRQQLVSIETMLLGVPAIEYEPQPEQQPPQPSHDDGDIDMSEAPAPPSQPAEPPAVFAAALPPVQQEEPQEEVPAPAPEVQTAPTPAAASVPSPAPASARPKPPVSKMVSPLARKTAAGGGLFARTTTPVKKP